MKKALHRILRKQINKLADMDSDDELLIGGQQIYSEGAYAKDTIQQILQSFRGSTVLGDEETFI